MNIDAARSYSFSFFENNNFSTLYYHNLSHTLDVTKRVTFLANSEKIKGNEIILLQTAALFHDLGIVSNYYNHEKESVQIIRKVLPDFGYKKTEIETICKLVLDTEISKRPRNKLGKLLRDADLDYLGRNDYFEISELLRKEWEVLKVNKYQDKEWYRFQEAYLKNHRFNSVTSCLSRNEGILNNIKKLSEILKNL